MGVVLMVAGVVNAILLRPKEKMNGQYPFWIKAVYFKLALSIVIFTPIFPAIMKAFGAGRQTTLGF